MEWLTQLADLFLHLDRHLAEIIGRYGVGTYAILVLIIFCETGLVVTPFLPGDSLLFAAGSLAALGAGLDPMLLFLLLSAAAIAGDTLNYWIGSLLGKGVAEGRYPLIRRDYLERTHRFYERHGGKTIVLARFVPIIRTFAPFVAGVGTMTYRRFLTWNVAGGILWVGLFVWAGYFFGNLPAVKENFSLVILAIIALSVLPIAVEAMKSWRAGRA
ncbi:MAG TPA: DedA family protein [Gemmatimonadales bacterium]|nr:DedA family protein [Gemmatimonadales bacterium]